MTLIMHDEVPHEVTPYISCSRTGSESWGGRHVSELSGPDVVSILEFCKREGSRQGWNDAQKKKIGQREEGPFHRNLLGGFPATEWKDSYRLGAEAFLHDVEIVL